MKLIEAIDYLRGALDANPHCMCEDDSEFLCPACQRAYRALAEKAQFELDLLLRHIRMEICVGEIDGRLGRLERRELAERVERLEHLHLGEWLGGLGERVERLERYCKDQR